MSECPFIGRSVMINRVPTIKKIQTINTICIMNDFDFGIEVIHKNSAIINIAIENSCDMSKFILIPPRFYAIYYRVEMIESQMEMWSILSD
jgi:hypothetical protein